MGIYEELKARGLIAQVTDEERIRDLVNNGKAYGLLLGLNLLTERHGKAGQRV